MAPAITSVNGVRYLLTSGKTVTKSRKSLSNGDIVAITSYRYGENYLLTGSITTVQSGKDVNRQIFNYDNQGSVTGYAVRRPGGASFLSCTYTTRQNVSADGIKSLMQLSN